MAGFALTTHGRFWGDRWGREAATRRAGGCGRPGAGRERTREGRQQL